MIKIDVSDIVREDGGYKEVQIHNILEGKDDVIEDILNDISDIKASFEGIIQNVGGGKLRLSGIIAADFTAECSRCLDEFKEHIDVEISEDFTDYTQAAKDTSEDEAYFWRGNAVIVDKPLVDMLILNLTVIHLCKADCKGLCRACGTNLNKEVCDCVIDSKMEV